MPRIRPCLLLALLLVTPGGGGLAKRPDAAGMGVSVRYGVENLFLGRGDLGHSLAVWVGGRKRSVIPRQPEDCPCLALEAVRDFDGTGTLDALVRACPACGGNSVADAFFFVVNTGNRTFKATAIFPEEGNADVEDFEPWGERLSILVSRTGEGYNTDDAFLEWSRYILDEGRPVKVDSYVPRELEAVFEIRSRIFDGETHSFDEERNFSYDLDGDGHPEGIRMTFWERWGRLLATVHLPDGTDFQPEARPKRFGVLASRTLGFHDLVFDQDEVYRWNGKTYVAVIQPSPRSRLTRRPEDWMRSLQETKGKK